MRSFFRDESLLGWRCSPFSEMSSLLGWRCSPSLETRSDLRWRGYPSIEMSSPLIEMSAHSRVRHTHSIASQHGLPDVCSHLGAWTHGQSTRVTHLGATAGLLAEMLHVVVLP